MKMMKASLTALACAGLAACSGGTITGKVTVAGGQSSGIAVFAYGPSSGAAVTGSDGSFTVNNLGDGDYVVRAQVRGTDEDEQSTAVTVKGGKATGDVTLAFHFSAGSVTGHVTFADGSDATGLSVVAVGPETKSVVTEAGGAFTLANLKSGAYIVSVEAPNTREGRVSVGVNASGTVDVGELRLTPVGHLTGTATYNSAPAVGVTVTVPGTGVSSTTDATGAFDLVNVPTGARTVFARTGESPFYRSASADVTVTRGENAAIALSLSDDPPPTGKVQGVVSFYSGFDPTAITVSVDGLGVTTAVSSSGAFSLDVPVGSWDIVAKAVSYPKQVLGHVVVHEGETINLGGQHLSWFRRIWTSEGNVSYYPLSATEASTSLQLLNVSSTPGLTRLSLLDVETGNLRFLSTGSYGYATISRLGKYVAWSVDRTLFVYTVATGALTSIACPNGVDDLQISEDETTLFVPDYTLGGLARIPIATPSNMITYPADGGASTISLIERGRWIVRTPTSDPQNMIAQVTPGSIAATKMVVSGYSPITFGYLDNGTTSTLMLYPADGGTPVASGTYPPGSYFYSYNGTNLFPCYEAYSSTSDSWFCVKMADNSHIALPDDVNNLTLNEAATRLLLTTTPSDGGVRGVYETPFPPTGAWTPVDTSTLNWNASWISPTRAVAVEGGGADARKLRVISNGTPAPVDNDTADGGAYLLNQSVVTRQKTTGNWRVMLGDGPFRTLPVSQGYSIVAFGVRSLPVVTRYGAFTFVSPDLQTYVVDESVGMVRNLGAGYCTNGYRSGTVELSDCLLTGVTGNSVVYDFNDRAWVDSLEDANPSGNVGAPLVRLGRLTTSLDGHSLMLGIYSAQ